MAIILGCVSQKGGVGKSTMARLVAVEFARAGWHVLLADMDNKQMTSTAWVGLRNAHGIEPEVAAQPVKSVTKAARTSDYNLVVFDGAPHATKDTLEIAKVSKCVLLPTGVSFDDLQPTVLLARELVKNGIPAERLLFVLTRVGSEGESRDARAYIEQAGYRALPGELPEKTSYRSAQNLGRAVSETKYETLNERGLEVVSALADCVSEEKSNV